MMNLLDLAGAGKLAQEIFTKAKGVFLTAHQDISGKANAADVTTALAAKADTTAMNTALAGKVNTSAVGAANGVAELDSAGKVPSAQLPSYVDDVIEYNAQNPRPASGESGKIYVDTDTNLTYRWSGSAYVEISPSLALGETSSTAYRGDRGKTAYDHSQLTSGNPHHVNKSDVGLANVDNTSDANKPISTATQTALDGKVDKVTGKGLSTNDYTTAEKNGLTAAQETITQQGQTITAQAAQIALLHELVNGISVPVYRTKSGNPISITDGAAASIKTLSVDIAPLQSGTGSPSSDNIRPISGRKNITVSRSVRNMMPYPRIKPGMAYTLGTNASGDANAPDNGDGTFTFTGTPSFTSDGRQYSMYYWWCSQLPLAELPFPFGSYKMILINGSSTCRMYFSKYKNGANVGTVYSTGSAADVSLEDTGEYDSVTIGIVLTYGVEQNVTVRPMLIPASETDLTWDAPASIATIPFTEVVNKVEIALQDNSSPPQNLPVPFYGGRLEYSSNPASYVLTATYGCIASYDGETLPGAWISDRDVYAPNTTPTTGAQVVYELAPADYETYQLTVPQLATLHGFNKLYVSAENMSVTYQADTALSLMTE